ncbi:hypothetical protein F2Q70_00038997 [Brassica cretica]|uniref:Uncharacterized protein n=1 Tax=Brassica cretica TaxID=69181 RepID=A0A8S9K9T3_BRACR|nr:hypothetical protein F2Q70_00038997 [Brassica cretica]
MSKAPRGTTRARSGRRLDFETPRNRAAHTDKASSGQNPDETLQPGALPTAGNLPPPTGSNEGEEIKCIDMDISDQSDHSDDGADIHPRRTRSQSARPDASFEKPMTEEEENLYWMKEMFVSAQKKTDEQGKLVSSLAKEVETLTAKAMSKAPRGTTRTRSGRRLDFETPGNRAAHTDKASSGQNPDETLQPGAQPTVENLPPPTGSNEGKEIERIDLDISDQSDHSDDGADIHPRRTRSQSARKDESFEKPMTEEEENLYWDPNPDPDIRRILQFLEGYPTPGYPRTPDPDKDNKIMDPPDKDPDPDTLKLPGYPIRLRPR